MHTSTIFDQTDCTRTAHYDGTSPDEYLSDSDSYIDESDLGSDDYNNYESNYKSNNEEASCSSTSTIETPLGSNLYNAYDCNEVENKLVIKIDQDDQAPKFSVADDISEVYGLPGIHHECINGQKSLRAVIDIDALQENMEANGIKAQERIKGPGFHKAFIKMPSWVKYNETLSATEIYEKRYVRPLPNEGDIYVGSAWEMRKTYILEHITISDDMNLLVLSTCHSYSNAVTTRLNLKSYCNIDGNINLSDYKRVVC
ncbi:hypothetical protein C1646_748105 [Rhizophagus diaphanus]|nr:hypothetical protein C1646_748105 [Rhizophagus diaphanus] [Rhizophagus sp. MUCL 43196]